MCLGWIFHVTDYETLQDFDSIEWGLTLPMSKVVEKVAEAPVHFMYHNDNGPGYIRMAEGTKPPRTLQSALCTSYWFQDFFKSRQLFLSKNGVVLFYGNVPFTVSSW